LERAVTQERAFETLPRARKNPLPWAGRRRGRVFIAPRSQGHDERIRAFAVEEIKRLHAQAASFGGAASIAYDYQIGRYNDLLRRIDDRGENRRTDRASRPPALRPRASP